MFPRTASQDRSRLFRIDLRALQLIRIVDVDRLPLCIKVDSAQSAFAMPVARGLGPAERQVHLGADGRRVYVSDAGVDITHGAEGLVDVASIDGRRKPIRNPVGDIDGLVESLATDQADHRPKYLFLGDAHLGIDVSEYRGLEEPSVRQVLLVERLASGLELGAFGLADLCVLLRGGNLLLVDLRAYFHGFVKAVADLQLLGAVHQAVGELAVGAFLHDHPAGRSATLTGGAERAPQDTIESQIEIGVVKNNDGVLSAHLE